MNVYIFYSYNIIIDSKTRSCGGGKDDKITYEDKLKINYSVSTRPFT